MLTKLINTFFAFVIAFVVAMSAAFAGNDLARVSLKNNEAWFQSKQLFNGYTYRATGPTAMAAIGAVGGKATKAHCTANMTKQMCDNVVGAEITDVKALAGLADCGGRETTTTRFLKSELHVAACLSHVELDADKHVISFIFKGVTYAPGEKDWIVLKAAPTKVEPTVMVKATPKASTRKAPAKRVAVAAAPAAPKATPAPAPAAVPEKITIDGKVYVLSE